MKRIAFASVLWALALTACQPAAVETPSSEVSRAVEGEAAAAESVEAPAEATDGAVTYTLATGETTLSYRVGEVFISQNNRFNEAVGVTGSVSGEIALDPAQPQNAVITTITAEVFEFQSDSSKRDNVIRDRFLESSRYPTVTFVPTEIIGLPESYTPGETIEFQVRGDVTIRETTLPLTFDVTARLEDGALKGQATTTFLMSDFGFGPISIAGILKTEDEVLVTLDFVAYP